jgi:hypothetical protein
MVVSSWVTCLPARVALVQVQGVGDHPEGGHGQALMSPEPIPQEKEEALRALPTYMKHRI